MFMALSSPTRTSIGLASCSVQCGLAASERPSVLRLGSADFKKGSRLENHSSRKPSHPPVEIGSRMTDDIVRPARHPHQHVLRDKTSLRVDQPFHLPPILDLGCGNRQFGEMCEKAELQDRKSTRLNSSHSCASRLPSS